ncbi:MAG: Uncharacterised protein [Prochlorococcus marinus str. MIT 9313]|nr:MAG: Uncharacterised protein [Prochlorococcus marinus str. MIT 9313]
MLQGCSEAATDHVSKDIEDHHIGVFQQVMLFKQLYGLPSDVTTATGAGWRPTTLDTLDSIEAFKHEVIWS